ncbi:DUF2336 domain-containing protein [Pelagibacterium flavum]|uniref:DUF2336 domain-containing protein n=1 Tax=Pelagibacterium flavum TaxID=2984530 RepID=A0ABY6ILB7_9HYPH|nr:DUF2336 domain-containing protein [Pelagibacterium sp. YIM 151497]UYQ71388.1 DUF2336 domain-containing protein [Pelagibacterium sp. YIM 151497]|eukprot:jgi/Tetstr1/452937/TSEL_039973.t1
MIGFQPYETFQLLIETGGVERANTLLVAACDAYARRSKPLAAEAEQFEALARRLFPTAAPTARAKAAGILASAQHLTPQLEILVYDHLGTGLIAHLERAQSLSDDLLERLIDKGNTDVIAAIARRPALSNAILARLFPINSRKVYRALAANTSIAPRGAYLNALTRSAEMDHEVAAILAGREDFDAALLTGVFFDLPEEGRINVLRAYARRNLPQAPMMRTFEQISVATNEFTGALMKLFSENRRPKITRLLSQITGLDEMRCAEIAHDTSGAALFVVLRAFGCTSYDGLKVLIHATSHDADRSKTLASFARMFDEISVPAMVYVMSAWRGDVRPAELTRPEYARFVEPSRRTPEANPASRTGTVGDQAIEALDRMKSARKAG